MSAIKRSSASASLTSPTIIRLGRIRRDSLINLRSEISPSPSKLAFRVCSAIQSGIFGFNSKTSSIVITRSPGDICEISAFKNVVFPDWVPPLTNILKPLLIELINRSNISLFIEPNSIKSANEFPWFKCLRILTAQCLAVTSGIATCNLLPSGNLASTNGLLTSRRLPPQINNLSIKSCTSSLLKTRLVNSLLPLRATNTRFGVFIQISSTKSSSIRF